MLSQQKMMKIRAGRFVCPVRRRRSPDAVVFTVTPKFWFFLRIFLVRAIRPTVFIFAHELDPVWFLSKRATIITSVVQSFSSERKEFEDKPHPFFLGYDVARHWRQSWRAQLASKLLTDYGPFGAVIFPETVLAKRFSIIPEDVRSRLARVYLWPRIARGRSWLESLRTLNWPKSLAGESHPSFGWGVSTKNESVAPIGGLFVVTSAKGPELESTLALSRELKSRSLSVLTHSLRGWSASRRFFRHAGVDLVLSEPLPGSHNFREWDPEWLEEEVARRINARAPELIVLMNDVHPLARAFLHVARKEQIPAFTVQNLYFSLDSRYTKDTLPQADHISVMDDYSESLLKDYFQYDRERLHNFGSPRFDLVRRKTPGERKSGKRVLLALQPPPVSSEEIFSLIGQFRSQIKFLTKEDVRVRIRPHPRSPNSLVKAVGSLIQGEMGGHLTLDYAPKRIDWAEFDAFVGFASNLHLEALLNDVPSVSIGLETEHSVPFAEMGVSVGARLGDGDVVSKVLSITRDPAVRSIWRERAHNYLSRNPAFTNRDSAQRILSYAGFLME